jgi:hypothetical protein
MVMLYMFVEMILDSDGSIELLGISQTQVRVWPIHLGIVGLAVAYTIERLVSVTAIMDNCVSSLFLTTLGP